MLSNQMVTLAREHPIEDILQNASEALWALQEGEPTQEALEGFRSLLVASEMALEAIKTVDAKCRPVDEWLRALDIVEAIRDECLETIEMLEML